MNMNDGGLMVVDSDVSNFSHTFAQKLKHGTWDHMGSNHSQPVCEAWTVTYLYRGLMFGDGETWHKHRCISVQLRPASYGWLDLRMALTVWVSCWEEVMRTTKRR